MQLIMTMLISCGTMLCCFANTQSYLDIFLSKYPGTVYQDLVMRGEIYPVGTDLCAPRYELIQPILARYKRPFSVLDMGAAQGYFSFRIAQDYPLSSCVMIEADQTCYYPQHGSMLYDLCQINQHCTNIR